MSRLIVSGLACVAVTLFPPSGLASSNESLRERASISREPSGSLPFSRSMATTPPVALTGSTNDTTIDWTDLRPVTQSLETPFASLSEPLLEAMRTHVRWKVSPKRERLNATFVAEHEKALALLTEHGVAVDQLMKERRKIIAQNNRIGRGANAEVLGRSIRLPGYIVPLTFTDKKVIEFLFVPVAGACVHTPKPPPNQIVHVKYPAGIAISSIFDAFWIEGTLSAEETRSDVVFHDGAASDVVASYALSATDVKALH